MLAVLLITFLAGSSGTIPAVPLPAGEVLQQTASGEPVIFLWNSAVGSGNITKQGLAPGSEFTVTVNVTAAPDFNLYTFNLEYHPRMVQFVTATLEGTVFWPDILVSQIAPNSFDAVFVSVWGAKTSSGNGALVLAKFKVLDTGLSIISITDSNVYLNGAPVTHAVRGGCLNNRPPKSPTVDFSISPAPNYFETSEYLLGRVAVGIVLPESSGTKYDWTDAEVAQTLNGIMDAMDWWASQTPSANLSFSYDVRVRVPTVYEPIEMALGLDTVWIPNVMNRLGYSGDAFGSTRAYINDIRLRNRTDWAFVIFVVDSDDSVNQGRFADGGYAHAYLGGPWITMSRYSSWAFNSPQYFVAVPAHETGHIFRATDEYDSIASLGGYLWVPDADGSYGIMNTNSLRLPVSTRAQVGLVDCDADGIVDVVDTKPAILVSQPPSFISGPVTISGKALVVPHPNYGPVGRDVTIGRIAVVRYRVDQGAWSVAVASDGVFDEALEDFQFNLTHLSDGLHMVFVEAVSSVGNSAGTSFQVSFVSSSGSGGGGGRCWAPCMI